MKEEDRILRNQEKLLELHPGFRARVAEARKYRFPTV